MGREIRRVPGDWEHPKYTHDDATSRNQVGQYRPLYDQDFEAAAQEWLDEFDQWRAGTHPDQGEEWAADYKYFWEHSSPPDKDTYRDRAWTDAEATHYQIYETVSEGTPVTPSFADPEQLITYLINRGTYWDHGKGWSEKAARSFVTAGWASSMIIVNDDTGTKIYEPRDGQP